MTDKKPLLKEKRYFDIKIETMLPATLVYRILAEDAQQAFDLIKGKSPHTVKHRLIGKRDIKATVYEAGTSMIKLILNLVGR